MKEPFLSGCRKGGHRTVYIPVTKRADASTLTVIKAVKGAIPSFKKAVPDDVDIQLAFDQSPYVSNAISSLVREALLGAVLTGIVVLLFLRDWRGAVIVVANIPFALATAVLALWATGQTINIMTLGGLALAVGVLVDEATVEVENIHTQLLPGTSRAQAVVEACQRTVIARLLSMLCVLAVFVPSFFMSGVGRQLFVPLSLAVGFAMIASYLLSSSLVSSSTEVEASDDRYSGLAVKRTLLGIGRSREIVCKLSGLFALDSFGGGFVVQSFAAYWFYLRFGVKPAALGAIFFGANILAGVSALLATRLASRIGLVRTMVFTHLPSNILLIVIPLMPTLQLAIGVLLLRFSISQMDVPTRQSYTMAVVHPEERSAAAGITGVARTIGACIPPMFVGVMFSTQGWINVPFFIAGTLKIAYDLLLYRQFVAIRAPEEEFR